MINTADVWCCASVGPGSVWLHYKLSVGFSMIKHPSWCLFNRQTMYIELLQMLHLHLLNSTPFTLNDITRHRSQLNTYDTYDAHSLFLQQPHALKSMATLNTPNRLHPTWRVSSLFWNLQTSIWTNNHKSSNSDYSCSINFSALDLSLQHPFSNLELAGRTCTFTFWGVLAPWRSCLYQGSPHVELVGETSSLTNVGVPRIVGASCEESCKWPMAWKNTDISPFHVQSNNESIHLKQIFNYNLHQMQLKVPILSCGCVWCISFEHVNLCNVHKNIIFFFVAFI